MQETPQLKSKEKGACNFFICSGVRPQDKLRILAYNALERKEKSKKFSKDKLREEFADVIITTFLLAKVVNVDLERALEKKIKKN